MKNTKLIVAVVLVVVVAIAAFLTGGGLSDITNPEGGAGEHGDPSGDGSSGGDRG